MKGIDGGMIDHALKGAQDDLETARILFDKQKNKYTKLSKLEFRNKMGAFLQRRGFPFEIISKLLKEH